MKSTKIAVIGGTGKSGKYLVQQLLKQEYSITLLLRNPEHFEIKNPLIEIVKGDARDFESVFLTLQNCDCVLSMLGQPKGESSIFSTATSHIIKAMQQLGLSRYIVTTGLNVNTSTDKKSEKAQISTQWMYEHYPETTNDKQKEYDILSESELNWTMVRLPLIRQTEDRYPYQSSLTDCQGDFISATDLAVFIIREMQEGHFIKQAPFLYTPEN